MSFPARFDSKCPRCNGQITEGTMVKMADTPAGRRAVHTDCTGEAPAYKSKPYVGEEAHMEQRMEAAFLRRQGLYD